MNEIEELKKEIEEIKARNKRVELDKKWETSWTRKICIAVITYIIVVLYTTIISKVSNVFLSSLVPVIGFLLSTLSVKAIRKIWEKKNV
jgi:polyferredoxin